MKIMFKEINGDDESMKFIILADDDGVEIEKFPIYINKEMSQKLPVLIDSYKKIPEMFKMIYESGLKEEKIEFFEEIVNI